MTNNSHSRDERKVLVKLNEGHLVQKTYLNYSYKFFIGDVGELVKTPEKCYVGKKLT